MVGLLVLVFAVATDVAAQSGWQTARAPGTAVSVEMPGKAVYKELSGKSGAGTTFYFHSYTVELGSTTYVMQTGLYPPDVDVSRPRANLQAAADGSGKGMRGGKWETLNWLQYGGAPAVECTGTQPDGQGARARYILKGGQMTSVGYFGAAGTLSSADSERFFNSVRLQ